ncbi:TPA: hypothetical protein QCX63_002525 [Bacillus pacificus]|nr:hypothetical protein [Bacillus pacificus]
MLQGDFDVAKKEIDDNLAKKVAKSGDTMLGNLTFQSDTESNIPFRTKTTNQEFAKFYANPTRNRIGVYSTKNAKNVWDYDGDSDSFNVNTNTNLLKKSEAFYTYAQPNGRTFQLREGDDLNTFLDTGLFAGAKLVNAPSQDYLYIEVIRYADANYTMQRATTLVGSDTGIWVRRKTGVIWGAWERLIDSKGGTMTCYLNIQVPGAGDNGLVFKAANGSDIHRWIGTNSGAVAWQDKLNNTDVLNYSSGLKTLTMLNNVTFNVNGNTNLLKKTGDTMTDKLWFEGAAKGVAWKDSGREVADLVYNNRTVFLRGKPLDGTVYNAVTYDVDKNYFNVQSDTNLLKKTGDTATGEMIFRHNIQQQSSDGKNGIVSVINLSQTKWAVGPRVEGTVDWSKELSMSLVTGEVSVAALKVKGERALTISDAEEKTPSRSGKDENGIFTTYEETQEDGKLWKRSVLSSPDADGNYLVRTVTYYKDGVAYKTKTFDLKYDEDGDFVKAVPR